MPALLLVLSRRLKVLCSLEYKVIATSVTAPVIEIVGVATIALLKAAVMVTVSDADKILSESVSVRVTVGEVWADRLKPTAKNNKLKSKKD